MIQAIYYSMTLIAAILAGLAHNWVGYLVAGVMLIGAIALAVNSERPE